MQNQFAAIFSKGFSKNVCFKNLLDSQYFFHNLSPSERWESRGWAAQFQGKSILCSDLFRAGIQLIGTDRRSDYASEFVREVRARGSQGWLAEAAKHESLCSLVSLLQSSLHSSIITLFPPSLPPFLFYQYLTDWLMIASCWKFADDAILMINFKTKTKKWRISKFSTLFDWNIKCTGITAEKYESLQIFLTTVLWLWRF